MSPREALIWIVGPFLVLALCGWFYQRGRDSARAEQKRALDERKEFLEREGFDSTPRFDRRK